MFVNENEDFDDINFIKEEVKKIKNSFPKDVESVVRHYKNDFKIVKTNINTRYFKGEHLHREGGPAIEWKSGMKCWYKDGKMHREAGPAKESAAGNSWYKEGKLHREDGPAFESEIKKEWWLNGRRHREDGPAVIYEDEEIWYINGVRAIPITDENKVKIQDKDFVLLVGVELDDYLG